MADYRLSITTERPYDATVAAVREQLAEAGFGVLTEVDFAATLKAKLDVDVAPQVTLGACRPQLAHQALQVEPSVAALLPYNVVVGSTGESTTVVEAFDPAVMTTMTAMAGAAGEATRVVSDGARARLLSVLEALGTSGSPGAGVTGTGADGGL